MKDENKPINNKLSLKMRKKIVAVISSDQKFMVAGWGVASWVHVKELLI
jgi:hypothetical protein